MIFCGFLVAAGRINSVNVTSASRILKLRGTTPDRPVLAERGANYYRQWDIQTKNGDIHVTD